MNTLLWFGIWCLSISWLFIIPIYNSPDYKIGVLFLLIGIGINSLCLYDNKNQLKISAFIPGVVISIFILFLQGILLPFYFMIAARWHRIDILSPVIYFIGRMLGLNATLNEGEIFIQNQEHLLCFTTNIEKLAIYPWINIFLGMMVILFIFSYSKIWKHIFIIFSIGIGYLIFRYIFLIFIFSNYSNPYEASFPYKASLFWNPFYLALSFLPLVLLMMKTYPLKQLKSSFGYFSVFPLDKKAIISCVSLSLCVFFFIGSWQFQDPGIMKKGRVLFDEYHSGIWEQSVERMGKEKYGGKSVYNYYCLANWLSHYYIIDRNINKPYNLDYLNNYDILILKTPTKPFSGEEVEAIIQFVKSGGGLFLIGDHTNLLGMNTFLNKIAKNFDIQFNYDATNELSTGFFSSYKSNYLFSHPIVQHMPQIKFLTSCTLTTSLWVEPVIIGYNLYSDHIDYSKPSFFGDMIPDTKDNYGLFLQAVAVKYYKGRVVAFGDSTIFSNFCLFQDGHAEFILKLIDFLNRKNYLRYKLNIIFLIFGVFCLYLFLWNSKRIRKEIIIPFITFIGLTSIFLSGFIFMVINKLNYPLPKPHTEYPKISFISNHKTNFYLPAGLGPIFEPLDKSFNTFFVTTLRVGYFPQVKKSIRDAIASESEIIVIINPCSHFTRNEYLSIKRYVEQGGKLLILDSIVNENSSANELLSRFGMKIVVHKKLQDKKEKKGLLIKGGNVREISDGVYVSTIKKGNGIVCVVVDAKEFSITGMGHVMDEPNRLQVRMYETEYKLFEKILS